MANFPEAEIREPVKISVIVGLLLCAAGFWGLSPALYEVHQNWADTYGHFSHGYLVLGMSLWLIWRAARSGRFEGGAPQPWALLLLLALVLAVFLSVALSISSISQALLPLVLLCALIAVGGLEAGRMFFWPIMLLYTALPVWWPLNAPLQHLTALVANMLVHLVGVPAFVEGNRFHLPAGVMEVADGCSGLNYLVAALSLSVYQGLLYLTSWRHRLQLIMMAILLALASNWIRVFVLMLVGYWSDMQHYLIRVDHLLFGWILFLICMFPAFIYGARLEGRHARSSILIVEPDRKSSVNRWPYPLRLLWMGGATAALLLIPALLDRVIAAASSRLSPVVPLSAAGPLATSAEMLGHGVLVPDADEQYATFDVGGQHVWLYRAVVSGDVAGSIQLPKNGQDLLGAAWQSDATSSPEQLEMEGVRFEQHLGWLRGQHVILRTGMQVAGYPVSSPVEAKVAALRGLVRLRRDSVLWLSAIPCASDDCSVAARRLDEFMAERRELLSGVVCRESEVC